MTPHVPITLVTAVFDLKRHTLATPFRRDEDHYRRHLEPTLSIDCPMVIYTEECYVELVQQYRHGKPTQIIVSSNATVLEPTLVGYIDQIRSRSDWLSQVDWLAASPQAALAGYNALVMSKPLWLAEQARLNPFGSTNFYWIDAGLGHTVARPWLHADALARLPARQHRFLLLCYPYEHAQEVHGFDKQTLAALAGVDHTRWVARGGFFGGVHEDVAEFSVAYQAALRDTLEHGLMGTEESIFTLISYRQPDLFDLRLIGADGLLAPFFRQLAANKPAVPESFAQNYAHLVETWFISFNAPRQFAMLLASIERVAPELLNTAECTLINNTTEEALIPEYERICAQYGIQHLRQNNIGINSARLLAAEIFYHRGRYAMVWFEDDMLLVGPDEEPAQCRNGMPCHVPGLAPACLDILQHEQLDYLMFSFTEVFGAHHEQWAWKNLDKSKREHYFPGVDKLPPTLLTEPRQRGNVSYTVGEVYYSNWPQLMTRRGTQKLLLAERWDDVHEQYWCARSFELLRAREMRAGVLLASPVNHCRTQFYGAEERREFKVETEHPARLKTIFVSIANYRDSETPHTIRHLFAQAAHPERVFVGVFSQVVSGVDDDCLPAGGYPPGQVRELRAPASESLGACWARHRVLTELMGDEDYVLQIDSHSRFSSGWDDRFIAMLHDCPSPRALLTTYPASYVPPNDYGMPCTPVLAAQEFNKAGILLVKGHVELELEFPPVPLPSAFLSGNCLFGPRKAFEEVPYDPYLYFHGEEISLAVRFWTHGWDLFAPNDVLMYTDYSTDRGRPRHWTDQQDWDKLNLRSFKRLRHIFRLEKASEADVLQDIARYELGTKRSLKDYERFADVSFSNRFIGARAVRARYSLRNT